MLYRKSIVTSILFLIIKPFNLLSLYKNNTVGICIRIIVLSFFFSLLLFYIRLVSTQPFAKTSRFFITQFKFKYFTNQRLSMFANTL